MIIAQLMFNQQQRFGFKPGVSNGPRNYFVQPVAMSTNNNNNDRLTAFDPGQPG